MKRSQSISQRPQTTQNARRPMTSSSQYIRTPGGALPPIAGSSSSRFKQPNLVITPLRQSSASGGGTLGLRVPQMRQQSKISSRFWDKASHQFQAQDKRRATASGGESLQRQFFDAPRPVTVDDKAPVKRGQPLQQKEIVPPISQFVARYRQSRTRQSESSSPDEHPPLQEIPLYSLEPPSETAGLPKPFQFLSNVGGKETSSKAVISPDFHTFSPSNSGAGLLYNPSSQHTITTAFAQADRPRQFTIFTSANVDRRTFYPPPPKSSAGSRPMTAKTKTSSRRIPTSHAQFRPISAHSSGAPGRLKLISPSGSSVQMEFLKENIQRIQREAESGVMPTAEPMAHPHAYNYNSPAHSHQHYSQPAMHQQHYSSQPATAAAAATASSKPQLPRLGLAPHPSFLEFADMPTREQLPYPELLDRSERTLAATFAKFKDLTYYTPVQRIGAYYDFVSRLKRRHLMDIISFLKTAKPGPREESTPEQFRENSLFLGVMSFEDLEPNLLLFDPVGEQRTNFAELWSPLLIKRLETSIRRYYQYLYSDAIEEREISKYRKVWMTNALALVPDVLLQRGQLRSLFSQIFDDYSRSQRQAILNYVLLSPYERQRLHILALPRTFPLTSTELIARNGGFNKRIQREWHQRKREAEDQIKLKLLTNNVAMSSLVAWFQEFEDVHLLKLNGTRRYARIGYSLSLHEFVELQLAYHQKVLEFLKHIWHRGALLITKRFKFLRTRGLRSGKWDFHGFHQDAPRTVNPEVWPDIPLSELEGGPQCFGFEDALEDNGPLEVMELQDIRENSAHISFVAMIGGYIDFNEDGYKILAKDFKREIKYSAGNLLQIQMRQFVDRSVALLRRFFLSFPTLQELMESSPELKQNTTWTTQGVRAYAQSYTKQAPPAPQLVYSAAPAEPEPSKPEVPRTPPVEIELPPFYRYQHLVSPIFRLDVVLGPGGAQFLQPLSELERMGQLWVNEIVTSFNKFPRPQFVKLIYDAVAPVELQSSARTRNKRFAFEQLQQGAAFARYFGVCRQHQKEERTKPLHQPAALKTKLFSKTEIKKYNKVARADQKVFQSLKEVVCDVLTVHYNETAAVFHFFEQFRDLWSGALEAEVDALLAPPKQEKDGSKRRVGVAALLQQKQRKMEQRLTSFATLLGKCRALSDKVALMPEIFFFPMFEVNCANGKRELERRAGLIEQALTGRLESELEKGARVICEKYASLLAKLEEDTPSAETVMEMEQFKARLIQTQLQLGAEAEENRKLLIFLIDNDHILSEETLRLSALLHHWPGRLNEAHDRRDETHREQRLEVEGALRVRRARLEQEVEALRESVKELESGSELAHHKKWVERIRDWQAQLELIEEAAQRVGDEEQMLFAFRSTLQTFEELRDFFTPFAELWLAAHTFLTKKKEWGSRRLLEVRAEEVDASIKKAIRVVGRLGKIFKKDAGASRVLTQLRSQVAEQNALLPKIEVLCNDKLRERHWRRMQQLVGANFNWRGITLTEISYLKFDEKLPQLADISDEASKELALEQILDKMEQEWGELRFELSSFSGIPILQGAAVQEIQARLDDHLIKAQNMRGSLYIRPFEARVLAWERTLLNVNNIIEQWVQLQTGYLYLEPVFNSQDMRRQMPHEAAEFHAVDSMWKDLMAALRVDTLVLRVQKIPTALDRLERANSMLQRVQRSLQEYLDAKRQLFPRFYFLSNEELLEILGERTGVSKLQTHLKKLFEGVAQLQMQGNAVTGVESAEGERVDLPTAVYPEQFDGNVERWLLQLESQLHTRVKSLFHAAAHDPPPRHKSPVSWLARWPAQVALTICHILWTMEVERTLERASQVQEILDAVQLSLSQTVGAVRRGKLDTGAGILLSALIVQQVHERDICEELISANVRDPLAFDWLAQLRQYYAKDTQKIYVRMVHTSLLYGYEYLGNTGRLVVTPLTDRCYRTLMGAIELSLGGAPEGPAGTGKTESTKDLAKAVGVQCVIFNCSEGLNAALMGQIFRGLASCGAWSCFDEFNRIELEVLSVVAQQILELQTAKRRRLSRFRFEDRDLELKPACNIFITMNPGYAGRSALPDNLKALFRPVAMMVPDYALIAEISLFSFGFQHARPLALKVVATLKLAQEQLSAQDHYDYGMRSVKAVLTAAAQLKQKEHHLDQETLVLNALRDSNLPKFLPDDATLFLGILADLFPAASLEREPDVLLLDALQQACHELRLQATPSFLQKCSQLAEIVKYRHGVMLVGAPGGKTAALDTLALALELLEEQVVRRYILNPKALSLRELYGSYDAISHDWADGVLVQVFREAVYKERRIRRKWLIFDGPVDTEWVENMNTVLDDTKKLCLSNGQTLLMAPSMRLLFEVHQLTHASPATISRCGMVSLQPSAVGWHALLLSWLPTLPADLSLLQSRIKAQLGCLLEKFYKLLEDSQQASYAPMLPICSSLFKIYGALLHSEAFLELFTQQRVRQDEVNMHLDMFCLYSMLWSIAALPTTREAQNVLVQGLRRLSADTYKARDEDGSAGDSFRMERTSLFPESTRYTPFDYYIEGLRWRPWNELLDKMDREAGLPSSANEVLIPTVQSLRYTYLVTLLQSHGHPVLLIGGTGTGKTAMLSRYMEQLERQHWVGTTLSFSSATKAKTAQALLESKLERRSRKQHGPPIGKKMLVIVDDAHLPMPDAYGAQAPLELLRQVFDHGGWYSLEDSHKQFKQLVDLQFLATMGLSGVGVSPRFLKHFNTVVIPEYGAATLTRIFSRLTEAFIHNTGVPPELKKTYLSAVQASVALYLKVQPQLRPTPKTELYMYNMRDLVHLMQGIQLHKPSAQTRGLDALRRVIRLWAHEAMRVFGDRVVDSEHQDWLNKVLVDVCRDKLRDDLNAVLRRGGGVPVSLNDLRWSDVLGVGGYQEVDAREVEERLLAQLEQFNSVSKVPMDLVLFDWAISHLLRIARVLRLGHALLVGIDGSGRRCLTRLAAYIQDTEMVEGASEEGGSEWLVRLLRETAVQGKRAVLYLAQEEVHGSVATDISQLVNLGEVPGLLSAEDLYSFGEKLRVVAKKEGRGELGDADELFGYFKQRIKEKLHVVLAFSPLGAQLRSTIRAYPGLLCCCSVDVMEGWPEQALQAVAEHFLKLGEERTVAPVAKQIHRAAGELAEALARDQQRYSYVTPATFLELLQAFRALLEQRRQALEREKLGYDKGVEKLEFTAAEVAKMQEDLSEKEPKLEQMARETQELMAQVRHQAENVVEPQRRIIQREEALTNEAFMAAEAMKNECKAELAVAKPTVDAAIAALNTIKPGDIQELRVLPKPPMVIRKVLHAVCVMCQVEPVRTPKPDNPKQFEENWWQTARGFMGQKDFLATVINFEKDHIPVAVMAQIRAQFLPDPEFKPSRAKQASLAAKGLCQWVRALDKYDIVAKEVAPKRAKAKESERAAKQAKRNLKLKQDELRAVEEHLERLKGELDFSARKRRQLEADIADCKVKIARATQLLDSLGGERQRWLQISREMERALTALLGDTLLSAAVVVYLGAYSDSWRERAVAEWASLVREAGVPGSSEYSFAKVMGSAVIRRQWLMNGLPSASYEGALIMQHSRKWPLFIDPQTQGNRWLKREYPKLHIARPKDSDLLRNFENCLQFGLPMLLEHVGETLDPRLEAVLGKQVFRQSGVLSVRLGDTVIQYNSAFQLFLTTKLPNPHYLPRWTQKLALIDLSITEPGLGEQLLDLTIQRERPALEEQRNRLIVQNYEHNRLLREAEEKILEILRSTGANILDNEAAIAVLQDSQRIAKETKAKQEAAALTEERLTEARTQYAPLAEYGAMLFFALQLLQKLHPMYRFSLAAFLGLYQRGMEKAPMEEEVDRRVEGIESALARELFATASRSLFERHKLLFALLLTLKTEMHRTALRAEAVLLLARVWEVQEAGANPCAWLEHARWKGLAYLQKEGGSPALASLVQNFARNSPKWRELLSGNGLINGAWPEGVDGPLDAFERLLVVKAVAPERLVAAIRQYVRSRLGASFVEPAVFDLQACFALSEAEVPLIFVLPGNDPLAPVRRLAHEKRKWEGMKKISLGQGTGPAARRAIEEGKQKGNWVLLENCHLAPSWMPVLERLVEALGSGESNCHPSFRLWLTTYSSPHFPALVLQNGVKIVNEPPAGLKANLLGSYSSCEAISQNFHGFTPSQKSLLFSLCAFHALIQERHRYGPLGWNEIYAFSHSDLDVSVRQLTRLLDQQPHDIPWNALRYLTAQCNYGGRVTDEHDRALLAALLEDFYNPAVLSPSAYLRGDLSFPYPDPIDYRFTLKFIREGLPLDQPARLFGFHQNADIVRDVAAGNALCADIFDLRGSFVAELSPTQAMRQSSDSLWNKISDLLAQIPETIDARAAERSYPLEYSKPMNAVLLHELARYNGLMGVIRGSLDGILSVLRGEALISAELEEVRDSIEATRVPKLWLGQAYPSERGLGGFIWDLQRRVEFMRKWAQQGPPALYWLPGFYYPKSFLTALLQSYARAHAKPIDTLDFLLTFRADDGPEDRVYQPGGGASEVTYIFGLHLEAASWNRARQRLEDPEPRVLSEKMPVIALKVESDALVPDEESHYNCPLYQTAKRGAAGVVRHFQLPATKPHAHWLKAGAALLFQVSH